MTTMRMDVEALVGGQLGGLSVEPALADTDLAELYRSHADQVFRWALRLGAPAGDAEDVVQDVFIRVHRRLGRRWHGAPGALLFGVTRNVVLESLDRARRRKYLEEAQPNPLSAPSPLDEERYQSWQQVSRILARLAEPERVAIVLVELEELKAEEAAQLVNMKLSRFRTLLDRARRHFRARLRDCQEEASRR